MSDWRMTTGGSNDASGSQPRQERQPRQNQRRSSEPPVHLSQLPDSCPDLELHLTDDRRRDDQRDRCSPQPGVGELQVLLSGLRNHCEGRRQSAEKAAHSRVPGCPVIFQPPALLTAEFRDQETGGEEQKTRGHAAGMDIKGIHLSRFYFAAGAGPTVSFSVFEPNLLQEAFTSNTSPAAASTL